MQEIRKDEPNLNLVSDLITLGANVDWQDEDNSNQTPLHKAAMKGNEEITRMLIDAGADVNVQNRNGETPLHWAARYRKVEIARMLIDAGARKDILNYRDRLPYDLTTNQELKNMLKP
jgi:ankyrin repeat protein